jgi:hypothetical protein
VAGIDVLYGISCPTTNWCEAVGATALNGEGVAVSLSSGTPGTPHVVPATKALTAVSCVTEASCEAVGVGGGHGVVVAVENGTPGAPQPNTRMSTFQAVSCSGSVCEGGGRSLADGAVSSGPSTVLTVPGTTSVNGIACSGPASCESIASTSNGKYNDVLVSLNGASLGPLQIVPPGTSTFTGIACHGSAACVAIGRGTFESDGKVSEKAVVVEIQSGTAKRLYHVQGPRFATLQAIACPSATFCEVVGDAGSISAGGATNRGVFMDVTNGIPGSLHFVPRQALQLNGISCPSVNRCWVVGENETKKAAQVLSLSTNG